MRKQCRWMLLACLVAGVAVTGCHGTASSTKSGGWFGAASGAKAPPKAPSKPLPRDTIPSAKEVGL
jgi:hypothetical protein